MEETLDCSALVTRTEQWWQAVCVVKDDLFNIHVYLHISLPYVIKPRN